MFIRLGGARAATAIKALGVFLLCALALIFSKESTQGAKNGLEFCFKVLVPSLFPFMALSSFIVKSGLSGKLGKPFGGISRRLFGLNVSFAPVIILSMLGGYPVGARGISALYKCGAATEKEAEKAAMFAVCAGPGFLINFVGVSVYGNEKLGLILCASQMLSVIILGIALNLFDKERKNYNSDKETYAPETPVSTAIVEAAADSSRGIVSICAFVILFSAFTGIINALLQEGLFENCIFCLLEVCSAVDALSGSAPIELIAFAAGFGGLSVHFQIYSALENVKVNKLSFFCVRIIQGVITALLTHFGLMLFAESEQVFSTATAQSGDSLTGSIISGAALTMVAIGFLYSLKANRLNTKRR